MVSTKPKFAIDDLIEQNLNSHGIMIAPLYPNAVVWWLKTLAPLPFYERTHPAHSVAAIHKDAAGRLVDHLSGRQSLHPCAVW